MERKKRGRPQKEREGADLKKVEKEISDKKRTRLIKVNGLRKAT